MSEIRLRHGEIALVDAEDFGELSKFRWHLTQGRIGYAARGRMLFLGYFDDVREAASSYNDAAKKYFGEFARPNEGL